MPDPSPKVFYSQREINYYHQTTSLMTSSSCQRDNLIVNAHVFKLIGSKDPPHFDFLLFHGGQNIKHLIICPRAVFHMIHYKRHFIFKLLTNHNQKSTISINRICHTAKNLLILHFLLWFNFICFTFNLHDYF